MKNPTAFSFELFRLGKPLKSLFLVFSLVLACGVSVGIIYIYDTTRMTPKGTVERYSGSISGGMEEELDIPENYAKPFSEMLITTHNHVNSLSLLFLAIALVFSGSTLIGGFWKSLLMTEPLIAIITTFGALWGMRYIHPAFVYITIASATLMYSSFYFMVAAVVWEILFKKNGD